LTSCWCKDYYIYIIIEMNVIEMDVYIEKGLLLKSTALRRKVMTKLISWNVNGLRACINKGFLDYSKKPMQIYFAYRKQGSARAIELELDGYHQYWNYAERKGYSGTAVFTRIKPLCVQNGIGIDEHDREGR